MSPRLADYWAIAEDFDARANEALDRSLHGANLPKPCRHGCLAQRDGICEHLRATA